MSCCIRYFSLYVLILVPARSMACPSRILAVSGYHRFVINLRTGQKTCTRDGPGLSTSTVNSRLNVGPDYCTVCPKKSKGSTRPSRHNQQWTKDSRSIWATYVYMATVLKTKCILEKENESQRQVVQDSRMI